MVEAARAIVSLIPDGFVTSEQLRAVNGFERDADLKKHLEKQGIVCFEGKNGIWTTQKLIEDAGLARMGLLKAEGGKKSWL